MLKRQGASLFVIVGNTLGVDFAVPAASARAPTDEHLFDQETHAFLLAVGDQLQCHVRWAALHRQGTGLLIRVPGQHIHPQLRRPLLDHRLPEGGSSI
jgi:hypothetical protein